jgi:hypothetical protein
MVTAAVDALDASGTPVSHKDMAEALTAALQMRADITQGSRQRVAYVPWWKPIPLVTASDVDPTSSPRRIGWVWMQTARLTFHDTYGWVAHLSDQTPDRLATCPTCQLTLENHP